MQIYNFFWKLCGCNFSLSLSVVGNGLQFYSRNLVLVGFENVAFPMRPVNVAIEIIPILVWCWWFLKSEDIKLLFKMLELKLLISGVYPTVAKEM